MTHGLKEWALNYLRHRDSIRKEIVDIQPSKDSDYVVKVKTGEWFVFVRESLKDVPVVPSEFKTLFFVLNTKENVDILYKKWDSLKMPNITFYFVNPRASGDSMWAINPYVHSLIADDETLKLGLETLYQTVETV